MNFDSASAIESVTWQMKLADWPRARNRALINDLFNGAPPYSDDEVQQNNIATNVNFLESAKIAHDARRQFSNAFLNPEPLFTVEVDYGPVYKRREWSGQITKILNKIIRGSLPYLETRRSQFALNVLHGIGPAMWEDTDCWCPDALGVEDVLIPSNTLLTMKNLPMFAVYRQYTGMQLLQKTSGPNVDPSWNLPLVKKCLKWVDDEARKLMGASWPEVWSPEKMGERMKGDSGLYSSDAVPTIDCWDFYFWNDEDDVSGWNRRIVLDAWGDPGAGVAGMSVSPNKGRTGGESGDFLFNPGKRKYAEKLSQIMHFQFADASSTAPFRYHSVRSLGFLLYSVCHLQNRMRSKFNDAVFEALLQYFRTASPDEAERVAKVVLADKAVIPEGVNFVPQNERWQVNERLVTKALEMNRQSMSDNSASFSQDFDFDSETKSAETATRTMAKVNSTAALVGAMLQQAYNYQAFQYTEICRRFCKVNSDDPEVREARLEMLKAGVPEAAINPSCWDVKPVRVIGGGNPTLDVVIADKLMSVRPLLDPDSQKEVDRIFIATNTKDFDLARRLVPEVKPVSDSRHDAQIAAGTLLAGLPVQLKTGINHVDYVEALLASMATKIDQLGKSGGMATPDQLFGLQNIGASIQQHIAIIAQDKTQKERVRQYGDDLGQLMNEVKAFAQRLAEQQQQAQGNGNGQDPELQARIQATILQAQTKADLAKKSHAARTAERQISWEMEEKRKNAEHQQMLQQKAQEMALDVRHQDLSNRVDIAGKDMKHAVEIKHAANKPKPKPSNEK